MGDKILLARDIMTRRLQVLDPHTEVVDAVQALVRRRHSGVPVVDVTGKLLGVFSEYDCLRGMKAAVFSQWPVGSVRTYMTTEVQTVPADMPLDALTDRFLDSKQRRLLVVADGVLVGIVSRRDLLEGLQSMIEKKHTLTTYEAIAKMR